MDDHHHRRLRPERRRLAGCEQPALHVEGVALPAQAARCSRHRPQGGVPLRDRLPRSQGAGDDLGSPIEALAHRSGDVAVPGKAPSDGPLHVNVLCTAPEDCGLAAGHRHGREGRGALDLETEEDLARLQPAKRGGRAAQAGRQVARLRASVLRHDEDVSAVGAGVAHQAFDEGDPAAVRAEGRLADLQGRRMHDARRPRVRVDGEQLRDPPVVIARPMGARRRHRAAVGTPVVFVEEEVWRRDRPQRRAAVRRNERQPLFLLRDRHDQPEVRLDQLFLGLLGLVFAAQNGVERLLQRGRILLELIGQRL